MPTLLRYTIDGSAPLAVRLAADSPRTPAAILAAINADNLPSPISAYKIAVRTPTGAEVALGAAPLTDVVHLRLWRRDPPHAEPPAPVPSALRSGTPPGSPMDDFGGDDVVDDESSDVRTLLDNFQAEPEPMAVEMAADTPEGTAADEDDAPPAARAAGAIAEPAASPAAARAGAASPRPPPRHRRWRRRRRRHRRWWRRRSRR